ncbi:DNA/RNA polymerase, partial [Ramicandelaber brevisporus]
MSQLLLLSRLAGNQRAILHLDLDCFYCQVEAKRLGIPPDLPAAVQQWNLLIAINYAAKARGVKRINNVADALAVCPELKLMHVMTYSADKPPAYYDNPDQRTHKACLNPYRTESGKFFGVLGKMQKCVLEKGGLDEGFMDVTAAVDSEFAQLCRERSIDISSEAAEKEVVDDRIIEKLELDWSDLSVVATGDASQTDETNANLMKWRWRDVQMWMAAKVAKQLRQQVYDKLQYRCSAGIAHNKLLAKLGSAMNKPNNQTVILEKYIDSVMENIPIDKMRNMGGKLGTTVKETFNVETAGELRAVPLEQLVKHLGNDQGNYVYRYCRGIDDSEVRARTEIKSMSSTKSLGKPAASLNEAHRWIEMVSLEIMSRI